MLQQIAETSLHRAFVSAIDVEGIGGGALLSHRAVALPHRHPRATAKFPASRAEPGERCQPRFQCCEVLLAGADATNRFVVRTPRSSQRSLLRSLLETDMVKGFMCTPERLPGCATVRLHFLRFDPNVGFFDVELPKSLAHPASLHPGR